MKHSQIEQVNQAFRQFADRFVSRETTLAQFVLILTLSVALAPLGSSFDKSPLNLLIGIVGFMAVMMGFLAVYCRLKERRVLNGRVRGSTLLLIAMPAVVCATVLWIHYHDWFGPTAH